MGHWLPGPFPQTGTCTRTHDWLHFCFCSFRSVSVRYIIKGVQHYIIFHFSLGCEGLFFPKYFPNSQFSKVLVDGTPTDLYFCVLGLKGDWPALTKLGNLVRHHGRESQKTESLGVCHLCKAGQPNHDFHKFGVTAMRDARTDVPPWSTPSSLTTIIPQDQTKLPDFYKIDLFHTGHKGVFGDLCANAIDTGNWLQ